jgi:ribosomal-protein-serine acetyltransferase
MGPLRIGHALFPGVDLRPWDPVMAGALAESVRDNARHIGRWLPFATEQYSEDDARAYIKREILQYADGGLSVGIWWEDRLVGAVGMNNTDWSNRSTHLGYWLAERAQGRGIMTRAVALMTDELLTARGFNRVVIAVQPDNAKSRAIPERLGFREEGTLRQVVRHGLTYVDWVIYAMLAQDWTGRA